MRWWPFKRKETGPVPPPKPERVVSLARDEVFDAIAAQALLKLNVADQHNWARWNITLHKNPIKADVVFTMENTKPDLRVVGEKS